MAARGPTPVPWPLSTFPGTNPQESRGRLINCYAEPLGEQGDGYKWVRSPGLSVLGSTAHTGYRGGLVVGSQSYECWQDNLALVDAGGNVTEKGTFPGSNPVSIARNQASPSPDVVAVDPSTGAFVLGSATVVAASVTATVGGGVPAGGDIIGLTFTNTNINLYPTSVVYTVNPGDTATIIATSLKNAINANPVLTATHLTATSVGAVVTISQQGSIGNTTSVVAGITGGAETVTFSNAGGNLAGGSGTYGAFTGSPTSYNAGGVLPAVNSVCFQDGYFFFTVADGRIFASTINGLTVSPLTEVIAQAKADVTLLRGIPFSGYLLAFTTGSCEVWQDAANPAPAFPYSRAAVLEMGLLQQQAIAGWETGFAELLWVGQDFGVHWMTSGGFSQIKVSPPDLDRLIEDSSANGDEIRSGCYVMAGKKFWHVSSPSWSTAWEFNLQTKKWNERQSLDLTNGDFVRWRALGGHPAFGRWLVGDRQSGKVLYIGDDNPTEAGAIHRYRIESGAVKEFPNQIAVARADFEFVVGVGQAVGNVKTTVVSAAASTLGAIVLQVLSTSRMTTGDVVAVTGVGGTTEANGNWTIKVDDDSHLELEGSTFVHAFTAGGTVTDLTSPPNEVSPSVAIYMSKDGGVNWGNPLIRPLGEQNEAERVRISVFRMGASGTMGVRWRLEVTDPVYVSLLGSTMSSELRP